MKSEFWCIKNSMFGVTKKNNGVKIAIQFLNMYFYDSKKYAENSV
jgi:hypothetical protein